MNRRASAQRMRFFIVTGFTGCNLILGLLALIAALTGALSTAAWCLLACALLDSLDGLLARHWRVTSAFGANLDSLADMTAFVIATTVLFYSWYASATPTLFLIAAGCMFVLAGGIRLARFNAGPFSTQYFQGIPTTFVAALVAIIYLTAPHLNATWGTALMFLLAVLMVSVFPYPKLSYLRKFPPWLWAIIVASMLINLSLFLLVSALLYIAIGPALWLLHHAQGQLAPHPADPVEMSEPASEPNPPIDAPL